MYRVVTVLLLAALEASTAHAADSVVQRQLTLDGAKRAVAAAVAYGIGALMAVMVNGLPAPAG